MFEGNILFVEHCFLNAWVYIRLQIEVESQLLSYRKFRFGLVNDLPVVISPT